ncbi:MAG: hypothetical protein C0395_01905 [Gemmatimonas sp.]|nr:hypothetical protein [Gemmatimonas sp.]
MIILLLMLGLALAMPGGAAAQCDCVSGNIGAAPNTGDPALGTWKYTIDLCWSSARGLSHWDLWIEDLTNCTCTDLQSAIVFGSEIGTTTSEDGCVTHYSREWRCSGEPSIDVPGILIKFEPASGCEPGHSGTGVFYFYSNLTPTPISTENPPYGFVINKNGNGFCNGSLSGVFPGIPCDPVPMQDGSWGAVKANYR